MYLPVVGDPVAAIVTDPLQVAQIKLNSSLLMTLGEWAFDTGKGFAWQLVRGQKNPNLSIIRSMLRNYLLSIATVVAVLELSVTFDRRLRDFQYSAQVTIDTGQTVMIGSSASSPVSPPDIPGLALWVRANLVTLTGSTVTGWPDQSGNKNDLSVPMGYSAPTYLSSDAAFSGKPSILWPDSTYRLAAGSQTIVGQPSTMYAVYRLTGAANMVLSNGTGGSGTNHQLLQAYEAVGNNPWQIYSGRPLNYAGGASPVGAHVVCAQFNGASSAIFMDSAASPLVLGDAGQQSLAGFVTSGATSYTAEIAIYSGLHTKAQIAQYLSYAAAWYGL